MKIRGCTMAWGKGKLFFDLLEVGGNGKTFFFFP